MYREHFESSSDSAVGDVASVDADGALYRAFALGVDSVLGNEHPEILEALRKHHPKQYVQMAYDEGQARARESIRNAGYDVESVAERGFEGEGYDPWEELVVDRGEGGPSDEAGTRSELERLDLPELLESSTPADGEPDALNLPEFLR